MRTGTDRISALQLFMVMALSRIIVTLLYIPSTGEDFSTTDLIPQAILAGLLLLATAVPIRELMRDSNNAGFLERCTGISVVFGKTSALLIFLSIIFLSMRVIMRFETFTTTVIFPQSDIKFFLVITILACLYCVILGLDVLGRTAEIFFGIVVFSVLFVLAATATHIKFTNFTPMVYGTAKPVLEGSLYSLGVTFELIYPLLLKDKISGKKLICVYPWIFITIAFSVVLAFWQAGALGDYAKTQLFPFFSLTSMTAVGFIERLDAALTAAWVVCEFVKISMYIFIGGKCINTLFVRVKRNEALCISAIIISLVALLSEETYTVNYFLTDVKSVLIVYLVLVVFLPLILLVSEKLRKEETEVV